MYGIATEKQFVNTLEDNIRKWGAMDKLISDRAQVEISTRVQSILCGYAIDSWQSEPHYQHHNFAERRYPIIKPLVNTILNLCGAPAYCWLLTLMYVCLVLNHTAVGSLHWISHMTSGLRTNGELQDFHISTEIYGNEDCALTSSL